MENEQRPRRRRIIPGSTDGRILFALQIRKRRLGGRRRRCCLLVTTRFGVWSVAERRYTRTTRRYRYEILLQMERRRLQRTYVHLVDDLGMEQWPQYKEAEKEITFWMHRLVDIFWDHMPSSEKKGVVAYYRRERRLENF